MNKANTSESTLNIIRSVCAKRDRKERDRLRANRQEMSKREETEKERLKHTNSILSSYIEKAKARECQHTQEHSQMVQNIHESGENRRIKEEQEKNEMSNVIKRALVNAEYDDRKASDDYLNRYKGFLDKDREAVKREQSKTYFS